MEETPPPTPVDARFLTPDQQRAVREERIVLVSNYLSKGWSVSQIVSKTMLSPAQVRLVKRLIAKESDKQIGEAVASHRARILFKNQMLQKRAWETLDRAEKGKLTREQLLLQTGAVAAGADVKVKRSDAFEAEARLIETIRKLQEQEAKIVGVRLDDPAPAPLGSTVNIGKVVVVRNDAELTGSVPWLDSIPQAYGEQGRGLLVEGEVVKKDPEPEQ